MSLGLIHTKGVLGKLFFIALAAIIDYFTPE